MTEGKHYTYPEERLFYSTYQQESQVLTMNSISLQNGKPRMIDRSEFIETAPDTWYKHPLALPSDVLLCAFVALRLLTSGVFELLEGQIDPARNIDPLLAILQRQVEAWQDHWLAIAEAGKFILKG